MILSFPSKLAVIICLLSIATFANASPSPRLSSWLPQQINSPSTIEADILSYVNEYRGKKGLAPLQMNEEISSQAEKHSADMASNKIGFGHDGFEDRVKIITKKIGSVHASAENVAFGKLSPKEVVDIWLKSTGHRKNIEGNYTMTGIGIATNKDNVIYFTQIFTSK